VNVVANTAVKAQFAEQVLIGLNRFQRVFLTTDGSVTELLEQYFDEPIKVVKLYEKVEECISQLPGLHQMAIASENTPILKRTVLLQGQQTMNNWVYAESSILLNNLSQNFRTDLLASREPIGKLWAKYRCETYKTMLSANQEKAGILSEYFNIQSDDNMISRTYSVYSSGKLVMVITEKVPNCFFCD